MRCGSIAAEATAALGHTSKGKSGGVNGRGCRSRTCRRHQRRAGREALVQHHQRRSAGWDVPKGIVVIASKLWRAGLQPRLGDRPDVSCEVRGKTFFIECKRPLTARGVKGRITDEPRCCPTGSMPPVAKRSASSPCRSRDV